MNDIGWAVKALKNGEKVARRGWNGRGMYLELHEGTEDGDDVVELAPFVVIHTVSGTYVPWTCSQSDFLAEDWMIV